MRFYKNSKVVLKNKASKYSRDVFTVYEPIEEDPHLLTIHDEIGRIITVRDSDLLHALDPIEYKNVRTVPVYNEDKRCYCGELEGISESVAWTSDTAYKAEITFMSVVDSYLSNKQRRFIDAEAHI